MDPTVRELTVLHKASLLLDIYNAGKAYREEFEKPVASTVRLIETRLELFAALDAYHAAQQPIPKEHVDQS